MTEGRVDVPVDREGEVVETGSGHIHEHGQLGAQSERAEDGADNSAELQSVAGAVDSTPDEPSMVAAVPPQPDTDQVQPVPDAAPPPAESTAAFSGTSTSPDSDEAPTVSDAPHPTPGEPCAVAAAPPQPDVDQVQSVSGAGDLAAGEPTDAPAAAPALRDPDEASLRLAEAVVFASATPVTPRALSQILPDDLDPAAVIAALQVRYAGRGLELCDVGGGLQFRTAADLAPQLRKVVQVPRRLPRVALETLAIVAYHQPITRPEIEDLRGTGLSQQTLDVLLENDLIVARGRKETPGRPTLWGTTAKFLEYFGLRDIRELPRRQDLLLEAVRPEAQGAPVAASAEDAAAPPAEPPPA